MGVIKKRSSSPVGRDKLDEGTCWSTVRVGKPEESAQSQSIKQAFIDLVIDGFQTVGGLGNEFRWC